MLSRFSFSGGRTGKGGLVITCKNLCFGALEDDPPGRGCIGNGPRLLDVVRSSRSRHDQKYADHHDGASRTGRTNAVWKCKWCAELYFRRESLASRELDLVSCACRWAIAMKSTPTTTEVDSISFVFALQSFPIPETFPILHVSA